MGQGRQGVVIPQLQAAAKVQRLQPADAAQGVQAGPRNRLHVQKQRQITAPDKYAAVAPDLLRCARLCTYIRLCILVMYISHILDDIARAGNASLRRLAAEHFCWHLAVCNAEPRQGRLVLQSKQARIVGVGRRHLQVLQRRQHRQRAQSHLPIARTQRICILQATGFAIAWRAWLIG